MAEPEFEYCEIKEAHLDSGFLGMGFGQPRPAYFVAYQGSTIISRSREFVFRTSESYSPEDKEAAVSEQIKRYKDGAHHYVLQRLLSQGWEPVGTDEAGRMTTLRRPVARSAGLKARPAELLRQIAFLRDAGILTQEEFEAKEAELLKGAGP